MTSEERERRDSRALEPELITDPRHDSAFRDGGRLDVSKMEDLLASLLANQLAEFYKSVGGKLRD